MNDSIGYEQISDAITIDSSYDALAYRYAKDADTTAAALGSVLATLKAAVTKGHLEVIVGQGSKQAGRIQGLLAVGSAGNTVEESAYHVRRVQFGDTVSLVLEPVYTAIHTLTATAVPAAAGALSTFKECTVAVASTGLLEGRTGVGPTASTGTPGAIEVPDIGPGVQGIVRIFKSATVTSVRTRSTKWE